MLVAGVDFGRLLGSWGVFWDYFGVHFGGLGAALGVILETLGCHWKIIEILGGLWDVMETIGKLLESNGVYLQPMGILAVLSKSIGFL